jgi:hypothetical protein
VGTSGLFDRQEHAADESKVPHSFADLDGKKMIELISQFVKMEERFIPRE